MKRSVLVVILVSAVLAAELGVRIWSYTTWRAPLRRQPAVAKLLEQTGDVMPELTVAQALLPPERFPAPSFVVDGPQYDFAGWSTFGEIASTTFRRTPREDRPAPGVVRVAFVGGSTTFDGYPDEVQALMDERFGRGRTETINLGLPASNSATTHVLMERFLPRWAPHVVVLHHGFNDVWRQRTRAQALAITDSGLSREDGPLMGRAGNGLFGKLRRWHGERRLAGPRARFEELTREETEDTYGRIADLTRSIGAELFVSTFPRPAYERLPADELDYFATELRYLWPVMGGTARYAQALDEHNRFVRRFSRDRSVPLIDVATQFDAGREIFHDNCHMHPKGEKAHARTVVEAISPAVARLLEARVAN